MTTFRIVREVVRKIDRAVVNRDRVASAFHCIDLELLIGSRAERLYVRIGRRHGVHAPMPPKPRRPVGLMDGAA